MPFQIDETSGMVSVKDGSPLDRETKAIYQFVIVVSLHILFLLLMFICWCVQLFLFVSCFFFNMDS